MTIVVKSHAKDYLIEQKAKRETPKWLGLLIETAIDRNGKISDEDKGKIYTELLKENGLASEEKAAVPQDNGSIEPQVETEVFTSNQKLTLLKITHIKGVNALISNQSITFSPACTIIYGLNGTGKSGYFRIIHELAGGDRTKIILDNIHRQGSGLEVDIDFMLDDRAQNPYKWVDKNIRGITPFEKIKVFDSEYLPFFLNERESSVNIEPLGLNLFQVIVSIIDEFKKKIDQSKQHETNLQPDLQTLIDIIHSDGLKTLLEKSSLTEEESQSLENYKIFSSEENKKLVELKQQKAILEKNNTEDSKKVLHQEKIEIDTLIDHLSTLKTSLSALTKETSAAINDYLEKKKIRDSQADQFKLLKNIAAQDTQEWQAFIESAKDYGAKIDQDTFNKDEKCVYCHQTLGLDALKLVQTYSEYLDDMSQQNLKNALNKIEESKAKLDDFSTEYSFNEGLDVILAEVNNDQNQTYKALTRQVVGEAKKQKDRLTKALKDHASISEKYSLDLLNSDVKLVELSAKRQKSLEDLQQSESQKKENIANLETEIMTLEDKQNISKWKTKIEAYYRYCKSIQKYTITNQAINTNGITTLGKRAHDELLTDSIRQSFEEELKALGKDIEVTLEPAGAGKGTVFTKLKILGNDVRKILSDGEQKAVGIALFLAEIQSQNNTCPIVFDDPVTSVDHEVADFLAQKLLKISSNKQIIIFTHNKLFYDSLIYWGNNTKDENNKTHHICKNYKSRGCSGSGQHVLTYKVDREAKDKTGRILEAQNESCQYFIEKAENELKGNYSLSCVAGYLKSGIEYFIDEKILLKTGLMKDRMRGLNVPWEQLKKLESKKDIVEELEKHWKELSDRGTHSTQNSNENPLKTEDLNNIITFLKS